jgi:hypothetical protein
MEIKRKQDFVISVLSSRKVPFEEIDISDPLCEADKKFMREHSQPAPSEYVPLPPQIFNDDTYCGDYEGLFTANENVALFEFLKLETPPSNEHGGQHDHDDVALQRSEVEAS